MVHPPSSAAATLRRILLQTHDRRALAELTDQERRHLASYLIRDASQDAPWEGAEPEWVEEVYLAIVESVYPAGGDLSEAGHGLMEAPPPHYYLEEASFTNFSQLGLGEDPPPELLSSEAELNNVGILFKRYFAQDVDHDFVDSVFRNCPHASSPLVTKLESQPDVQLAGEVAHMMLKYGVSPVMVAKACYAVGAAMRRYGRLRHIEENNIMEIDLTGDPDPARVPKSFLTQEVNLTAEVEERVGEALFDLLIASLPRKRNLFHGFRAVTAEPQLVALQVADENSTLRKMWQPDPA